MDVPTISETGDHFTSGWLRHRNTCAACEAALRQADSELNSPSGAICRVSAGLCSETETLETILLFSKTFLRGW